MTDIIINSFSDLDRVIDGVSTSALCRGVSNASHVLRPSLFHHKDLADIDIRETNLMWLFKTSGKALLQKDPQSELEWLVIAQHHGLPTRLLDWSLSPLVACFFSVQSLSKDDGAIYIYDPKSFKKEENIELEKLDEIVTFIPSHTSPRVTAQSGIFTVHPTDCMDLDKSKVTKLIIPADQKPKLLERLVQYGIHHGTIFPDLDGLARYLKYRQYY
jgi:hypothetical protein